MHTMILSDMTMREFDRRQSIRLSFREKLEFAKLLDQLEVPVIELSLTEGGLADRLLIKSVCSAVKNSTVAVNVGLNPEKVPEFWEAMGEARHPRLQVVAPVSSVQMEYISGKKAGAMAEAVRETIARCRSLCPEVELVAEDATRAEPAFLYRIVAAAVDAGASVITLCDTAGTQLPDQWISFLTALRQAVPQLSQVRLGVGCSNELAMADSCAIAAIRCGASEVKCISYGYTAVRLETMARVLQTKADELDASCPLRLTSLRRILEQISALCRTGLHVTEEKPAPAEPEEELYLTVRDDMPAVLRTLNRLGYEIAEEDRESVYEAFLSIAEKKEKVGTRELDAIIAAATMQVPATYRLESFVITTGNTINATAHVRLTRDGVGRDGIGLGDGPIDAAFLAIEQITGHAYELDDFQISAVTEERQSMGQTIIRLRSGGRVCTGFGISTDIIGASIRAYLSALNKIAYEESVEASADRGEDRI